MFLSIVMPVRNEALHIERTISQLLVQDYDPARFEILVVDGESTDETAAIVTSIAQQHPHVHLYSNPKRLSSAARNVGVRHAQGDAVLIVDGHCEIRSRRMLRDLAEAFETSGADCIGRPQPLDVTGATPLQQAIAAARSSRLGHHPDSFIYSSEPQFVPAASVAVAYRREVFDKVGYFDEAFDACEDFEFNTRCDKAGLRCYFAPSIAVHYQPRNSLTGLFRQLTRYGRGRVRLLKKHPETLSVKTLIPGVFVAGLIVGLVTSFVSPWLAMLYVSVLAIYAFAVIATSLTIASKQAHSLTLLPWLPAVFATIHVSAGSGLLVELTRSNS